MTRNHLDGRFRERHFQQSGRGTRKGDDVLAHPVRLGIDVDPITRVRGMHADAPTTSRPAWRRCRCNGRWRRVQNERA